MLPSGAENSFTPQWVVLSPNVNCEEKEENAVLRVCVVVGLRVVRVRVPSFDLESEWRLDFAAKRREATSALLFWSLVYTARRRQGTVFEDIGHRMECWRWCMDGSEWIEKREAVKELILLDGEGLEAGRRKEYPPNNNSVSRDWRVGIGREGTGKICGLKKEIVRVGINVSNKGKNNRLRQCQPRRNVLGWFLWY